MSASVAPVPPPERPSLTVRPTAETMPWVTLLERPSGEPIARTICPTSTSSVSAELRGPQPPGDGVQLDDGQVLLRVGRDQATP